MSGPKLRRSARNASVPSTPTSYIPGSTTLAPEAEVAESTPRRRRASSFSDKARELSRKVSEPLLRGAKALKESAMENLAVMPRLAKSDPAPSAAELTARLEALQQDFPSTDTVGTPSAGTSDEPSPLISTGLVTPIGATPEPIEDKATDEDNKATDSESPKKGRRKAFPSKSLPKKSPQSKARSKLPERGSVLDLWPAGGLPKPCLPTVPLRRSSRNSASTSPARAQPAPVLTLTPATPAGSLGAKTRKRSSPVNGKLLSADNTHSPRKGIRPRTNPAADLVMVIHNTASVFKSSSQLEVAPGSIEAVEDAIAALVKLASDCPPTPPPKNPLRYKAGNTVPFPAATEDVTAESSRSLKRKAKNDAPSVGKKPRLDAVMRDDIPTTARPKAPLRKSGTAKKKAEIKTAETKTNRHNAPNTAVAPTTTKAEKRKSSDDPEDGKRAKKARANVKQPQHRALKPTKPNLKRSALPAPPLDPLILRFPNPFHTPTGTPGPSSPPTPPEGIPIPSSDLEPPSSPHALPSSDLLPPSDTEVDEDEDEDENERSKTDALLLLADVASFHPKLEGSPDGRAAQAMLELSTDRRCTTLVSTPIWTPMAWMPSFFAPKPRATSADRSSSGAPDESAINAKSIYLS